MKTNTIALNILTDYQGAKKPIKHKDMKTYCIDIDVTFSTRMYISAKDEESARKEAISRMIQDPHYHTRMGAHVNTEIVDAWIDED